MRTTVALPSCAIIISLNANIFARLGYSDNIQSSLIFELQCMNLILNLSIMQCMAIPKEKKGRLKKSISVQNYRLYYMMNVVFTKESSLLNSQFVVRIRRIFNCFLFQNIIQQQQDEYKYFTLRVQ